MVTGFFALKTPQDLLKKVEHDYELLSQKPNDVYAAFNFFVTADCLISWVNTHRSWQGHTNIKSKIQSSDNIYTKICHSLAIGAKHLIPTSRHAQHIKSQEMYGYYKDGYIKDGYFEKLFHYRTHSVSHFELDI